ncbi:MAG: hypothetical protein HGA47_04045 [Zoogloea sp.]|nr:hypothetical protein [Zoogloea sp.]
MFRSILNHTALVGIAIALSACASQDQSRVVDAATVPLNDLNLVHAEIPAVLAEAEKQPYVVPANLSCVALDTEVRELDSALGPDLDTPASESNPGLIERGSDEAKKAAVGALRRTTEGIVPFRGWVRKLSGAERYSKKVAAAIAAGTVRRAFIKGIRISKDCA